MKKRVLSLLMASAMIVGLTACGSSNEPAATASTDSGNTAATTADNSGSAAAGNVSMTFTWWGNQTRNERTQAALDLYSEQNPGVTFDTQPAEWNDYWTKLSTLAAGNSLPECLQMDYSYLAQYVAADLLVDLTPYVEDGTLDVSNVSQSILGAILLLFVPAMIHCKKEDFDVMSVSSYGSDTKSSGVVKIVKDLDESLKDKEVIVVEDIVDSGRTLSYLLEMLKDRGPASLRLCTLLDKPERRVIDVHVDYTGFNIPDEFVVGYGLDYDQRYRNLPYIGVVEFD